MAGPVPSNWSPYQTMPPVSPGSNSPGGGFNLGGMDAQTLAMLAGMGIQGISGLVGANNEAQVQQANLNFQIQKYNQMMGMTQANMAHGVNPFAQQMMQFVGQPLAAGSYGNSQAYTGGIPSYVGPQPTTGPYGTGGQQTNPYMAGIQAQTQAQPQSAYMLPQQQMMQQQMMQQYQPQQAQAQAVPSTVQYNGQMYNTQGLMQNLGASDYNALQKIIGSGGPVSSAPPVQQPNPGYPVGQKPAWVDEYVAMTPEQRTAAMATVQEGTPQYAILNGLNGGYTGQPSPQYAAMIQTPGYWSGTSSQFWSPEDQQAFGAFNNAPPTGPVPNVAEANSRYIINGYEYSVPRGDPRAEQLAQGIIPEGLAPTNTPEGQGGGGYSGGFTPNNPNGAGFTPGAGGMAGGAGQYNFGYNPTMLGAAPQVGAPGMGMAPQIQASMLGGFNPYQAQQSANPQQLMASQIGGFQPFQAPQLGGVPQMQASQIGGTPSVDFTGIQAQTAQAPGGVNVQQAQTPGAVMPQMVSGVGTSGFNPGQDGLLQMMRRDVSAPMDASINPELQSLGQTFDNSSLFAALGTQDQRGLDEQVNQLRGSVGSFGQRFGSGLLKAEADLRGDFLANTGARNAQIQAQSFEAGMGRQAQGLGMRIGREQFGASLPFQNAGLQMQAAQAAAGNALQGGGMDLQAQLANQSAGLQAGQFNAGMQSQTSQFNAGNALTADLAQQGLLGQYGLANVQNNLAAQQSNLGAQLQTGQFNAGQSLQQQLANQQAAMQGQQFNIGNYLQQQQFGAGQQQQAGLAGQDLMAQIAQMNQAAQMQAGQFNIGNQLQNSQFNAGQNLQAGLAGQSLQGQYGLANQASSNNANQFNAGNILQNQQFGAQQALQAMLANQSLAGQYGMANQSAANQAGQFNAQMGLQGAQFGAQRNDIYNQLVMQALGQANSAQQGTNQYNLGLMGLMAGVGVPQAQPSPWPGAIGEIGSMAMGGAMLYDYLRKP